MRLDRPPAILRVGGEWGALAMCALLALGNCRFFLHLSSSLGFIGWRDGIIREPCLAFL